MMRSSFLTIAQLATAASASAQSAIESHVWQEARSFEPGSRFDHRPHHPVGQSGFRRRGQHHE